MKNVQQILAEAAQPVAVDMFNAAFTTVMAAPAPETKAQRKNRLARERRAKAKQIVKDMDEQNRRLETPGIVPTF